MNRTKRTLAFMLVAVFALGAMAGPSYAAKSKTDPFRRGGDGTCTDCTQG